VTVKGLLGAENLPCASAQGRFSALKPFSPAAVRRRNKKCTVEKLIIDYYQYE